MDDHSIARLKIDGIGSIWVARNSRGLAGISIRGGRRELLRNLHSKTAVKEEPSKFINLRCALERYARGKRISFREILDLEGTEFQRRVWRAIASIPWGETRSYKWVAAKAGRSKAVRAAAQACGANPIPIIVPCHRVIASDGGIGGFSGGIALKRKLLKLEGVHI